MPVSGSANPNEPPAPGQPKALSDEPNTNLDVGLPKPSEYDVSRCMHLVAQSTGRRHGGTLQCVADTALKPSFESPVAALP